MAFHFMLDKPQMLSPDPARPSQSHPHPDCRQPAEISLTVPSSPHFAARLGPLCLALAVTLPQTLFAQDQTPTPALAIELNQAVDHEGGCLLSFVARNETGGDITRAVFETVLFTSQGQVDRLSLFDFGALPDGRPRVRQFVVPQAACDGLGQVLFNGAQTCDLPADTTADATPDTTPDAAAQATCDRALRLTTRTQIEVTG
jgi:hypothetical protein